MLKNTALIVLKLGRLCLRQCDSHCRDCVIVRSTLVAGKYRSVDRSFKIVHLIVSLLVRPPHTPAVEYHGASWSTKRLVCGCGDDVGVREGGGYHASGDKARDVCHVGQ